jgi:hypothetical protein
VAADTVIETAIDGPTDGHSLAHRLVDDVLSGPVETAFGSVDRLIAWAESQRLALVAALRDAGRSPLELLDDHSVHVSTASLTRAERRADVLSAFPTFSTALMCGHISVAHLDRLGDTLRRLLPHEREQLAADHARLLLTARTGSAGQFGRFLTREVARYERLRPTPDDPTDDPAEARFAAQQAGIRLTSHADRDTGMTIYRLALDPLRTLGFDRRLTARVEALHHGPPIPGCPTDPLERQAFLRAHALLQLLESEGVGARTTNGAEVIVVIDHTTPDGTPDIDWGRDVDIPDRVLRDLLDHPTTHVHQIVVRNGVIVAAPGRLDLGRSTRLANRAQRRALRALHRTCAVPGCDVRFDHCTIHHVTWWRHGGRTDLDNLLPICSRHHHLVHDRGWQLTLGPNRELTVTTPSGRVMTTGPPQRWAA